MIDERMAAYRAAMEAYLEAWERLKAVRTELTRLDQAIVADLTALAPRPVRPHPSKIPDEVIEATIQRYCAGEHLDTIGQDYGISGKAVLQRVRRAGIPATRRRERVREVAA